MQGFSRGHPAYRQYKVVVDIESLLCSPHQAGRKDRLEADRYEFGKMSEWACI